MCSQYQLRIPNELNLHIEKGSKSKQKNRNKKSNTNRLKAKISTLEEESLTSVIIITLLIAMKVTLLTFCEMYGLKIQTDSLLAI